MIKIGNSIRRTHSASRRASRQSTLIPVYVDAAAASNPALPFGIRDIQGIVLEGASIENVATTILKCLDEAKRHEMYFEMQKIVHDEGGVVIPVFANNIEVAHQKVRFENPAGNWEMAGHRAAERWWFES